MQKISVQRHIGGRTLSIETGTLAKLAGGSVTVQYGETVVMAAVVRANPREGIDFFPAPGRLPRTAGRRPASSPAGSRSGRAGRRPRKS